MVVVHFQWFLDGAFLEINAEDTQLSTELLEQISTGLKKNGLLRAIQSFLDIYALQFVYVGKVTVEDVLNAVYVDFEITVLSPEDDLLLSLLKRFISDADSEGNVLLVHHFQLKCQALSSRTLEQITLHDQ